MEKLAFTFKEFCALHNFSRTTLYDLFRNGKGPAVIPVGRRRLISVEAAKEWRESMGIKLQQIEENEV